MNQPIKKWTKGEWLVLLILHLFGTFAMVVFPPLLAVYFIGCIFVIIYWYAIKEK
jgi:hypothetical protein